MDHPYHNNNNINNEDESTIGSNGMMDDQSAIQLSNEPLPQIFNAGLELESLLRAEMSGNPFIHGFPPTCLPIARLLGGNHCCVDCGDEKYDRLVYASIGYGSLLCQECATRHINITPNESNIRHIKIEDWDLRSALCILEGGNTKMLDYVKHKPRWRPPKFGSKSTDSEDVLAFKQIYLSKAATTYRQNLVNKVDEIHYEHMSAMRDEDAAKEEQLEAMHTSEPDPFQRIFERNNMSGDEIPGFYNANNNSSSTQYNGDASIIPGTIAGVSLAATAGGTVVGGGRRKGRNVPLMKHETPSADLIKQRIHMRRSMNVSIAMNQHMAAIQKYDGEMGDNESVLSFLGRNASENATQAAASYVPKVNTQRRNSDQMELVGEVAGTSSMIIDQYDGGSIIEDHRGGRSMPPQIQHQDEQDSRQMAPYYSRVMYRRTSMEGSDGGGQKVPSQQVGQFGAQRRPVCRATVLN